MIEKLFLYILIYSYLLPAFLILLFAKKVLHQNLFRLLVLYAILFFVLLYIQDTQTIIPKSYTKLFYYLYTTFEYSFFSVVLLINIRNRIIKKIILIASLLFYLFQIIYYLNFDLLSLDTIPIGVESILIFIYIFLYFYEHFKTFDSQTINKNYFFWIITGIIFYLASSFFFYILANNLSETQQEKYWYISYIFDIIKNILFAIAVIVYAKKNIAKPEQKLPDLDYK